MQIVPRNIVERITFYKSHLETWQANHDQIGVDEEMVAEMAELVEQTHAAHAAQRIKQQEAQSATQALRILERKMNNIGQAIITRAKSRARSTDREVYSKAALPSPKRRSRVGPPGAPEGFKTKLSQDGTLELKWKCRNPEAGGTIYQVSRRIGQGPFTDLARGGTKKLIDRWIPAGTSQVTYRVQAIRGSSKSPISDYVVNFAYDGPRVQFVPLSERGRVIAA